MVRRIESGWNWTESLAFATKSGVKVYFKERKRNRFVNLAFLFRGLPSRVSWRCSKVAISLVSLLCLIFLFTVHATQTFEFCAREASQIFGGASYLRSGPGEVVERLYREVRVMAIGA